MPCTNCKTVKFDSQLQVYEISNEDRKSHWMLCVSDRLHFKRRVEKLEPILNPIIQHKHKLILQSSDSKENTRNVR
jgi:hypothetical protein